MNCSFVEIQDFAKNASVSFKCNRCQRVVCVRGKQPPKRHCVSDVVRGTAGSNLKRLLKSFFIAERKGCKCFARALDMDRFGNDWCEQNIETIVEWLKEEAAARGLPFISTIGRMIVRRAISTARREAERAKDTT